MGPILAAKIIGTVGSVARLPSTGATLLPTQARRRWRPRERGGGAPQALAGLKNRHLNYALHMVAVCQASSDARGGVYYRKKIAEGKSRKEALRCLNRRGSSMPFSRALWQIRRCSHAAPLDKEEPRTPSIRSSSKAPVHDWRCWVDRTGNDRYGASTR